jgi:hypothetical protein
MNIRDQQRLVINGKISCLNSPTNASEFQHPRCYALSRIVRI